MKIEKGALGVHVLIGKWRVSFLNKKGVHMSVGKIPIRIWKWEGIKYALPQDEKE